MPKIITPETHPDHPIVGKRFTGWDGRIYFCDSYDSSKGYWMVAEGDPPHRTCISERAIGQTFHIINDNIVLDTDFDDDFPLDDSFGL